MHKIELLINNGPDPQLSSAPWIRLESNAKIVRSKLGGNNTLGYYSCLNRTQVGRYSGFGSFSYLVDTEVGRYATIGSRVSVGGFNHPVNWLSVHEFQYRDTSRIYGANVYTAADSVHQPHSLDTNLGDDVWVGDNVVILRGVKVSTGVIVGAGSVVTKDIEPYMIAVGNPARVLRPRFEPSVVKRLLELRWWELELHQLRDLNYSKVDDALNTIEDRIRRLHR